MYDCLTGCHSRPSALPQCCGVVEILSENRCLGPKWFSWSQTAFSVILLKLERSTETLPCLFLLQKGTERRVRETAMKKQHFGSVWIFFELQTHLEVQTLPVSLCCYIVWLMKCLNKWYGKKTCIVIFELAPIGLNLHRIQMQSSGSSKDAGKVNSFMVNWWYTIS